ncbi:hypothetical protein MH117_14255 [Paenibacillus sp. ACRRX]|uniref:hypothetical protein n=1 Tax=Paenibacillus sp. ACRRX TaxID=2918206 RepID=UPI001EF3F7B8|nr:hypothetical protein [Paenibacillus sp. ACRRX]MCG7408590.1 hypothetical protein [Paenibacillus sp. ACRRX]
MDYDFLSEQFKRLSLPNQFTLKEIDQRLKTRYLASSIDISYFEDLSKDPHACYADGVAAYKVDHPAILKELCERETTFQQRSIDEKQGWFNYDPVSERTGYIFIESKDHIYPSGWTVRGGSALLYDEIIVLSGIEPQHMVVKESFYQQYLRALVFAGYIYE